jgi:hypothetical protein
MSLRSLLTALRRFGASLAEWILEYRAAHERYRALLNSREARGKNLLREWLSAEQRAQFDAQRYFDVVGCDSGKRYRIHYGIITNVHELDEHDRLLVTWCFLPELPVVAGDVMLAQKIALENYEYAALAVANRFTTPLYRRNRLLNFGRAAGSPLSGTRLKLPHR